jgi:hypothetical protein
MPNLILNLAGTNRIFRPDGNVVTVDPNGSETIRGQWTSASPRDANRIQYDFDGADAPAFDVDYSFNDNNQLVATIPGAANGGTDSTCVFLGSIDIDDNHDVKYKLFDEQGDWQRATIVVHGDLSFGQLDQLTVTLPDGKTTAILGDDSTGRTNVQATSNAEKGAAGSVVAFSATTYNTINGRERSDVAAILFTGDWGVNENGLVFKAGLTPGAMKIQFGGTYKGITAGLAYYSKGGDQQIAFTINGKHQFKSPSGGDTSVNWLFTVENSNTALAAVAELGITHRDAAGNKLTLGGKFQFVAQPGQSAPPKTEISLDATYQTKGGQLVFSADFTNTGGGFGYNLRLEGTYQLRNGQVSFAVQLQKTATSDPQLTVSLGSVFTNKNLQAHLNALLTTTPSGKIDYSLNFDIRARWVNGELMADPPKQVTAS